MTARNRSTVNRALTPDRARPVVENTDYVAFSRRVICAAGRRIASSGDVDGLPQLAALVADLDVAIGIAVGGLRSAGYSWGEIAARLGITRQAAQQRWAHTAPAPADVPVAS